jgi:hypothetical protein
VCRLNLHVSNKRDSATPPLDAAYSNEIFDRALLRLLWYTNIAKKEVFSSRGMTAMKSHSDFTIRLVETKLTEYCESRIPVDIRNQVRLIFKITRDKITLIETRPYYRDPPIWTENPVAQFRLDKDTQKWTLHFTFPRTMPTVHLKTPYT